MFTTKFVEEVRTHILCSATFLKNLAIYGIICKNMVQLGRPHIIVWDMQIACWISKSTDTQSVTLAIFSLQQWLHERV